MRARVADLERLLEQTGVDPSQGSSSHQGLSSAGLSSVQRSGRRRRGSFPDEEDVGDEFESDQADQETDRRTSSSNHIVSPPGDHDLL
jgi:hypothetical protein